MAPRLPGFTRASSLGPIASFMDMQGGSIDRVLRRVDLPFTLLEQPETVIPLREQFRFLEEAARDTGDGYFGARLGRLVRARELSAFGAWVCAADTLLEAIGRCHAGLNVMLQTSTILSLERKGPRARWSIAFVEPETEGRHHNELLGISYMIDTVRQYAGGHWRAHVVRTALPSGTPRAPLEEIMSMPVSNGHAATSIEFDAALLGSLRWTCPSARPEPGSRPEPRIPGPDDAFASIAAVTELALHGGYPRVEWVAAKLGTSTRSLQRRLGQNGTTFTLMVEQVLARRAKMLLEDGTLPVTGIALELGYRDLAHFSRAFRRWTGSSPSAFRAAVRRKA